jgi:hypothetical protein
MNTYTVEQREKYKYSIPQSEFQIQTSFVLPQERDDIKQEAG